MVANSADSGEKVRRVEGSDECPLPRSQPHSNVGWDIPAIKKQRCLSAQNTPLLDYPCVFCFLNVGDGQP